MDNSPPTSAYSLVRERFPDAIGALLAGSNANPLIISIIDILNLTGGALREGYRRTWST